MAYILYKNQYAGNTIKRLVAASLLTKQKGNRIFNSCKKSPFTISVYDAKRELCLRLTHKPGQNPRPAMISPSAARELWLDPTVAPAAILLCPFTSAAQRKELLSCCSCAGKSKVCRTAQQ